MIHYSDYDAFLKLAGQFGGLMSGPQPGMSGGFPGTPGGLAGPPQKKLDPDSIPSTVSVHKLYLLYYNIFCCSCSFWPKCLFCWQIHKQSLFNFICVFVLLSNFERLSNKLFYSNLSAFRPRLLRMTKRGWEDMSLAQTWEDRSHLLSPLTSQFRIKVLIFLIWTSLNDYSVNWYWFVFYSYIIDSMASFNGCFKCFTIEGNFCQGLWGSLTSQKTSACDWLVCSSIWSTGWIIWLWSISHIVQHTQYNWLVISGWCVWASVESDPQSSNLKNLSFNAEMGAIRSTNRNVFNMNICS